MADIYGKLTEHPELPIEDPGHFTVEIKFHEFEAQSEREQTAHGYRYVKSAFCARCGFSRVSPVHPKETA